MYHNICDILYIYMYIHSITYCRCNHHTKDCDNTNFDDMIMTTPMMIISDTQVSHVQCKLCLCRQAELSDLDRPVDV